MAPKNKAGDKSKGKDAAADKGGSKPKGAQRYHEPSSY